MNTPSRFFGVPLLFGILFTAAPMALAQPAPEPEIDICRSAGFWQTHSGSEKDAPNIAAAVLGEATGCVEVCGEILDDTLVDSADSVLEAVCVSSKSSLQVQLARQLAAAALNCIFNTGAPECLEGSAYCNDACSDGVIDDDDRLCISYLQCTNDGGLWQPGLCLMGTCSISGAPCGTGFPGCPAGETCDRFEGNCATAPLVNEDLGLDFDPIPNSSSSKACNAANKTRCTVVGDKESECLAGVREEDPEVCGVDNCEGVLLDPGNGILGCWHTAPSLGLTCDQVCAPYAGFNAAASQHTGNAIGEYFWPGKVDGGNWVSVECSSTDNNTNWGANGTTPDPFVTHPACYMNCACNR